MKNLGQKDEPHFVDYAHQKVGSHSHDEIYPGKHRSTLRFWNANNALFEATKVTGGSDDALRIDNRSFNLKFRVGEWRSGGRGLFTVKGGCDNILLSGKITQRGRSHEVDLDRFSDESHKASTNIHLNLTTQDGSPVRYKSWLGARPIIVNPEQKYKCVFFLPHSIGVLWHIAHRFLKFVRLFS